MAAAGNISTIFDLYFDVQQNTAGTETYTIASLGGPRSFRVLEVLAYNVGGTGVLAVNNTNGNAIVGSAATISNTWKSMILTAANLEVATSEGIAFTINGAAGYGAGSKVIIRCMAGADSTASIPVTTP